MAVCSRCNAPVQGRKCRACRNGGLGRFFVWVVVLGAVWFVGRPYLEGLSGDDFVEAGNSLASRLAEQGVRFPDPAIDPAPPPVLVNGSYHVEFAWAYGGNAWEYRLDIPKETYDHYHGRERPMRLIERDGAVFRQAAYDVYVTDPSDDRFIQDLGERFRTAAEAEGWSQDETLSFVLAFVQSLPYTTDSVTSAFDEYPRYPIETLVDGGGDCEDTSILYAGLVRAMGYQTVLLSPPQHMAVGVAASEGVGGIGYEHRGTRYLYAETTGDGWALGEVPEPYAHREAQVFSLQPQALLDLDVELGSVHKGHQELHMEVANLGSADATDVRLVAELIADGRVYDRQTCPWESLAPQDRAWCDVRVRMPLGASDLSLRVLAIDAGGMHDRATFS